MSIPREAYSALQSIVGNEWVSDDPAIREADRICTSGGIPKNPVRPACSIEPGSGEEVQAIVKVANRYKLPYIATSTYYSAHTSPKKENTILIDLKRMNKLEIDEENLYAVVEPGVCFAALQAELFKKGLCTFVPGCGGNSSVLANTLNVGDAPSGWRYGLGYRRLLAAEWVLPDGEMLRLGSRSTSKDFFWGEGPGPDLRALTRGVTGWKSRMGIVTKLGVKLFPFISEKLEPEGWSFHTRLNLPTSRLKWYNIRFLVRENAIKTIFELGRSEIGLVVMSIPPIFRAMARSRGTACAGFWESWNEIGPKLDPTQEWLRVLLFGIGSKKRLEYEEKVLLDIVADNDGSAREAPARDESQFMAADAICATVIGGRFHSIIGYESVGHGVKFTKIVNELTEKHKPPILEDYGTTNFISPYDLGYVNKIECLRMTDKDHFDEVEVLGRECHQAFAEQGAYPSNPIAEILGPVWDDFPEKERRIKEIFDPNSVSNPS
jgi:hypothetical protein